jgi:hypothetical protein
VQQIELLGKAMLYDEDLSVNRNEACAFCPMPETGFTGPVSELNRTTGSYPGSVRTRFSNRKPQTHTYAPLSPVLHYNPGQGDLGRCRFSRRGASAQPAFRGRCALGPARAGESGALSGPDAAECREAALSDLRQGLRIQRLFQESQIDRAFYNTRDVLPRCGPNDPGEGTTCWPASESTQNMNTKFVGRLGLSGEEEDALVSFMQTLSDGFTHR